jgi:hypothetical protein
VVWQIANGSIRLLFQGLLKRPSRLLKKGSRRSQVREIVRGGDGQTGELFSYVDLEARVRRDHPLRRIRAIVNEALSALEREFAALYSPIGRPSIPPEKLLRAMLLKAFYSIRS